MRNLIQTINGEDYSQIDSRAFDHNGSIIDLGCIHWDWSGVFIGKKNVVGADPFEKNSPNGTQLFTGVVSSFDGRVKMIKDGGASRISRSESESDWIESLSWKSFCSKFRVESISVLKMNIEGAEYSLLHSMDIEDFSKIDQLAISFHDWLNPNWKNLTLSSIQLLNSHGFSVNEIGPWGWHLAVKAD